MIHLLAAILTNSPLAAAPQAPVASIAAAPQAAMDLIEDAVWISRATAGDLERLYPSRAVRSRTSGAAVVLCRVTATGTLASCRILAEKPETEGFGQATVEAAARFRMRSTARDGRPVEGRYVRIPVVWNIAR